jgi:hypothetical protein
MFGEKVLAQVFPKKKPGIKPRLNKENSFKKHFPRKEERKK